MKLDKVANSGNDEFYTPQYAVDPILKYVPTGAKVWCPFDTERSLFVKSFQARGNEVVYSHLDSGEDFFHMDFPDVGVIVSNPPYSLKTEVLERLFESRKRFAMLIGVVGLFESRKRFAMLIGVVGLFESQKRFDMFKNNKFEIMYFNRRIAYFKDYDDEKPSLNPPFSSVYLCRGLLPQQIVFETVNKTGK